MSRKKPLSVIEVCNFFYNGYVNGFVGFHDIVTNIEDNAEDFELKRATWRLGFNMAIETRLEGREN